MHRPKRKIYRDCSAARKSMSWEGRVLLHAAAFLPDQKCNALRRQHVSGAISGVSCGLGSALIRFRKICRYRPERGTFRVRAALALVVAIPNVDGCAHAAEENLEAVPVAVVTESPRLVLKLEARLIDLSRAFLDNGCSSGDNRYR